MTRYTIGRRLEYQAIRELEKQGWLCSRTAGSRGLIDVFCWHPALKQAKGIQIKKCKKRRPPKEPKELIELQYYPFVFEKWFRHKGKWWKQKWKPC